jgi:predicted  nucleic acid-binding Zn-ribbon protein
VSILNEQLEGLVDLQGLDSKLDKLRDEIRRLPQQQAELKEKLEQVRAKFKEREDSFEKSKRELRLREMDLKSLAAEQEKYESEIYGGRSKSSRELAQLEHKVENVKKRGGELEDRVLELMIGLEELTPQIEGEREESKKQEEILIREIEDYKKRLKKLKSESEVLSERREKARIEIDIILLKRYEYMRERKGGIAIVEVTNTICPGCHISLPPSFLNRLKAGEEITYCENCGRFMYWKG